MNFWSVKSIAFSVAGYDLSWLELVGTIFNLWSVWLMTRNRILTWPVGIVGVVVFGVLFWQMQLYADFFEQIYYFATGFWGWWLWKQSGAPDNGAIERNSLRENLIWLLGTAIVSFFAGWANSNLHLWMPRLFPTAASFAYLDATTTIMSFSAQILMARRRLECWPIWIAVDVIGIWLYREKGMLFVSGLYCIFLALAIQGLFSWRRQLAQN
ncbi:MAG TPA: nicotinamide riboside transporter PnuC [Abditibacteriaceae bacterium]|jgi:nicotinamide mononucleotide transporter